MDEDILCIQSALQATITKERALLALVHAAESADVDANAAALDQADDLVSDTQERLRTAHAAAQRIVSHVQELRRERQRVVDALAHGDSREEELRRRRARIALLWSEDVTGKSGSRTSRQPSESNFSPDTSCAYLWEQICQTWKRFEAIAAAQSDRLASETASRSLNAIADASVGISDETGHSSAPPVALLAHGLLAADRVGRCAEASICHVRVDEVGLRACTSARVAPLLQLSAAAVASDAHVTLAGDAPKAQELAVDDIGPPTQEDCFIRFTVYSQGRMVHVGLVARAQCASNSLSAPLGVRCAPSARGAGAAVHATLASEQLARNPLKAVQDLVHTIWKCALFS